MSFTIGSTVTHQVSKVYGTETVVVTETVRITEVLSTVVGREWATGVIVESTDTRNPQVGNRTIVTKAETQH